jgi:hypothetical protein
MDVAGRWRSGAGVGLRQSARCGCRVGGGVDPAVDRRFFRRPGAAGIDRRFRVATGLKPTEYCQHLRVGKAREMLEFTNGTIDHIAWTVARRVIIERGLE